MAKRNIVRELMEGVAAMKDHRQGKITLRSYKVEAAPLPKVDSKLIRDTRKRLRFSRAVFARKLRINERTLEKWEQGRAKPNPQAAALVLLVRRYPDTLARLDEVAEGEEATEILLKNAKGGTPVPRSNGIARLFQLYPDLL